MFACTMRLRRSFSKYETGSSVCFQEFSYWKEGPEAFKKHQGSDCHHEAIDALVVLPRCTKDVGDLLSSEHQAEKTQNRDMLLLILQNIRFLARQGLPLRGDSDESDSNFSQLLRLRGANHQGIELWLSKKTNKYTSHDIHCHLSLSVAVRTT